MKYQCGRIAIGVAAAFTFAVPAMAQTASDLPAYKQPSRGTDVTYDQAIACQAAYVVLGSEHDTGTEERNYYDELYDSWYEFSAEVYPIDFAQHHDADIEVEANRLVTEWTALDETQLTAVVERQLSTCETLEDVELMFI